MGTRLPVYCGYEPWHSVPVGCAVNLNHGTVCLWAFCPLCYTTKQTGPGRASRPGMSQQRADFSPVRGPCTNCLSWESTLSSQESAYLPYCTSPVLCECVCRGRLHQNVLFHTLYSISIGSGVESSSWAGKKVGLESYLHPTLWFEFTPSAPSLTDHWSYDGLPGEYTQNNHCCHHKAHSNFSVQTTWRIWITKPKTKRKTNVLILERQVHRNGLVFFP